MKTLLKSLIYLFIALFFILFIVVYLFLFSNRGLQWGLNLTQRYIYPSLKIESATGLLGKKFTLYNVTYQNETMIAKIGRLDFYWNPYSIFKNSLVIHSIESKNVMIFINNHNAKKSVDLSEYKKLFKKIILHNFTIDNLAVYADAKLKAHIDHFNISTSQNSKKFIIEANHGILSGNYSLLLNDKWNWWIEANAYNVDTNSLWNNSNAIVSFKLLSKGRASNNIDEAILQITHIQGHVVQFPLLGTVQIHHNYQKTTSDIDLEVGKAFLKIAGDIGENSHLNWTVDIPKLENIYPLLSGSIYSKGIMISNQGIPLVNADIQVNHLKYKTLSIDSINGSAVYKASNIQLNLVSQKIAASNYHIPEVRVNGVITYTSDQITAIAKLISQDKNTFNIHLNFPHYSKYGFSDIPLNGHIILLIDDINKLIKFPRVKSLYGKVAGNIKINGTLSKITYLGDINLLNGHFYVPEVGIFVRDIRLHAQASQLSHVNVDGNLTSNQGKIFIKGIGNLENSPYPFRVNIKGNQFQVANTKEYKIVANPDLLLSINGENASITGKIIFPKININLPQYNEIVNLPSEFEFVGKKTPQRYFKNLALGISLEIQNEAYLLYKDLNAYLVGKIFVSQVPGGLPSGKGVLLIKRGTYRVYDKKFGINDGRLIYVGNLIRNPGLNIRAMKQTSNSPTNFMGFKYDSSDSDMSVGVSVTGTLLQPTIEFISNPPMNQDDILSNILFGQSRSNISGFDALSLLSTLTTSLGVQGPTQGNQPPSNGGFASIFKIGFFNPVQTLNFSLPISKSWRIKTETNPNEVGIDLHYFYESK